MRMLIILWLSFSLMYCTEVNVNAVDTSPEAKMLEQVNQIRMKGCKCGNTWYPPVGPVTWNNTLKETALKHSREMADKGYFSHTDLRGNTAETRMELSGYIWKSFGENLFQTSDPSQGQDIAIEAWKNSPGHCANLMKPYFTEMGMAGYKGYWTQLFGSR